MMMKIVIKGFLAQYAYLSEEGYIRPEFIHIRRATERGYKGTHLIPLSHECIDVKVGDGDLKTQYINIFPVGGVNKNLVWGCTRGWMVGL